MDSDSEGLTCGQLIWKACSGILICVRAFLVISWRPCHRRVLNRSEINTVVVCAVTASLRRRVWQK